MEAKSRDLIKELEADGWTLDRIKGSHHVFKHPEQTRGCANLSPEERHGDSIEEAYELAVEVAHIQLEELANEGKPIPKPGSIAEHRQNPDFEGWGWGMIEVDLTPYLGKTEKINVTLPGRLIKQIDDYVNIHSVKSRSAFLARAALRELERST